MSIELALYQPDIANNTGTLLRLGACMGMVVHIIHPAGFSISRQTLARAGLDYLDHAVMQEHASYAAFQAWRAGEGRRVILLTTKATESAYSTTYKDGDILMLGRESAGVPDGVAADADLRIRIPMLPGLRSINVALAASMVTGEAMRQTGRFAKLS